MANDTRLRLYKALNDAGYDIGEYDEFDRRMNNSDDRGKFYKAVSDAGFDIGPIDEFDERIRDSKYKLLIHGVETPVSEKEWREAKRKAERRNTGGNGSDRKSGIQEEAERLPVAPTMEQKDMEAAVGLRKPGSYPIGKDGQLDIHPVLTQRSERIHQRGMENAHGDLDTEREVELSEAYAERKRLEKELEPYTMRQASRIIHSSTIPGGYAGGHSSEERADMKRHDALLAAKRQLDERIATLEESRDKNTSGFWRNLWRTVTNPSTWSFGLIPLNDALASNDVADKLENGTELNEQEETMLRQMVMNEEAKQKYGDDKGFMARAGTITGEALPFVAEFLLTGGYGGVTKGVGEATAKGLAKMTATDLSKKGLRSWLVKSTGTVAGDVAGATLMANTTGVAKTASDVMERQRGSIIQDENGDYHFGHYEQDEDGNSVFVDGGKTWAQSIYEAEAANTLEYYTEMLGNHMEKPLGAVGSWIAEKTGLGKAGAYLVKKLGLGEVSKDLSQITANGYGRAMKHVLERGGIQDYPSEVLEEEANIILNSMFVGDNSLSDLVDGRTQADIWGGMLFSVGFMNSPAVGWRGIQSAGYLKTKHDMEKADKLASYRMTEDRWKPLRERIDGTSNEDMTDLEMEIKHDDTMHENEKKAALDYIGRLLKFRGWNIGATAKAKDEVENPAAEPQGAVSRDLNASYIGGYEADDEQLNDIRNGYEFQRQRIEELAADDMLNQLDADPIGALNFIRSGEAWTEEEKQTAIDYVNAKAAYDGMIHRVQDDIDGRIAMSDAMIESRKHHDDGMIHPATMKTDDRKVYVIGGKLVMNEDGTMIDHDQSDESVIIRDAATGAIEFADPHDVLSTDEALDAAQEKEAAQEAIRQQYAQEAANKIDGVLPFNNGDTYQVVDDQGQQHTVTVIPTGTVNSQGQVLQTGDGEVVVSMDGGEPVAMSREAIQNMAENVNLARLQQYVQEKAVQREEQAAAEREANRPVYNLNDEVTLQTEEGMVRGSIAAEANEDGLIEVYTERPIGGKQINLYNRDQLDGMVVEHNGAVAEPQPVQNEGGDAGGEAGLEQTGANEPSAATPSTPVAEATVTVDEPMPMIGEGEDAEPDFSQATPQRAHTYIYNEAGLSRDEANQFVEANRKAADKALEKAQNGKPKMGTSLAKYRKETAEWQQKVEAAQQVSDYWKQVKDEQGRVLASEAQERAVRDAAAHEQAVTQEQARQAEELRKREEQSALGTHTASPAIREKWESAHKVEGARNEIVLANGERVPGRYVLVESGAATPSHNPRQEFVKNEGFPMDENGQSVNDRDYERDKDAQATTRQIASVYDQRALQTPVVVTNDGIVLSGNGRTMAGELAAQDGTDGAYIEHLKKYGRQFGFTPEQMEGMAHPRVVFVPDEAMPYTADTFAKFNQQEMKGQSKTEQAVKLGKVVGNETFGRIIKSINAYDTLGEYYADPSATTQAVNELRDAGAISQAQYAEMFDGETISAQGREVLENMLIGKAFESNPDAVRQITSFKGVRQSVITALAEISNNLMLGEDYSHESELAQAINLVYQARQSGYKQGDKVSGFARQQNLFAFDEGATVADFDNATVLMYADLLNEGRPTLLKKALALYNQAAKDSANGQLDIFSGGVKTQEEILYDVKQLLRNGTEEEQQAALAAATAERKAAAVSGISENGVAGGVNQGGEVTGGIERTDEREGDLAQAKVTAPLSNEVNEFDKPFVLSSDGTPTFGEVTEDSGLTAAPIKLSLGENIVDENGSNHGYGLLHIEAGHGNQIRAAGFASVEDFVEAVARNYDTIREGSVVADNQTYLLEVSDEHNNTLFVQLSKDGGYWNVNSAGIFKKKYSRRKPEVFTRPALEPETNTDFSGVDSGLSNGVTAPAGNSPQTSAGKGSNNNPNLQEKAEIFADGQGNMEIDGGTVSQQHIGQEVENEEATVGEPQVETDAVAIAEREVNTNPTPAQKDAGNYKKGHVKIEGFDVTIENPRGSERSGTDANGHEWRQRMNNTYGYIRGTEGVDGDHIDVFLSDSPESGNVYVIDQRKADGSFDEHKVMYGFGSADEARAAYLSNYEEGWQGLGAITEVSKDEFKKWIDSSHRKTKPFAEYKSVKTLGDTQLGEGAAVVQQPTEQSEEPQPVGRGVFGNIYDQFKGKAKEAIAFLRKRKEGVAKGALHHRQVGDIDVVWGDENRGLAHIDNKHTDVATRLQEVLDGMSVVSTSENRIVLDSPTHRAVVSKDWYGEPVDNWLLTAYGKKNGVSGGSIDIVPEPEGKQNGTAPLQNASPSNSVSANTTDTNRTAVDGKRNDTATPQNTVSEGKGNDISASEQGNAEKSAIEPEFEARYQISPKPYTTKRGKVLDMQLVMFPDELKDKVNWTNARQLAKELKGWWSREDGGFLMRDAETAQQLADTVLSQIGNNDAMEQQLRDERLSLSDMALATDEAQNVEAVDAQQEADALTQQPPQEAQGSMADNGYGANNTLVSRDRYEELKERMRKKMLGQLNMGIDPEILAIGTEMAAFHIEAGARKFADFAKKMIEDLGDAIRPYLKSFYNGARELPEVGDAGYSEEMSPYDEVRAFDVLSLGGETTEHSTPTVFERAEEVTKELDAERQAEEAKEKIAESKPKTTPNPLRPATEADFDNAHPVVYYDGKPYGVIAVMHSGEQISATQFSQPHIESIVLTNGKSVNLDNLQVFDEATAATQRIREIAEKNSISEQKRGKSTPSKKKRVSLQQEPDLFGNSFNEESTSVESQNKNDNDRLRRTETAVRSSRGQGEGAPAPAQTDRGGELPSESGGSQLQQGADRQGSAGLQDRRSPDGLSQGESVESRRDDNGGLDSGLQERRNDGRRDSSVQGRDEQVRSSSGRPVGYVSQLTENLSGVPNGDTRGSVRPGSSNIRRSESERGKSDAPLSPVSNPKNLRNNHAERGKDYAPRGVDARIDANIKAIELMKQLMDSGEQATPEQMAVLRQFSGWGGLGKAFENYTAHTNGKPTPQYLRELLGEEAYQQANMSRNSAYYTPANVIDALWDVARAMGFKGGRVLEGSAGIGNILGLMPTDMSERSDIHAVEIDPTTGNILSLLYPDAKVDVQGFEATQVENGSVDLAITNVPFVTGLRVNDTTGDKDLSKKFHDIHDFCIAKNVRKLREGGMGIFITSSGTLDNSARLRQWIIQEGGADVVGAFRLNNETFGGTGATSDIIVIRKRVNGKVSPHAIDVLSTTGERTAEYDTGESKRVKGEEIPIIKQLSMDYNSYFVEHPEMMGGEMHFGFEKGETFRPTSKALYPVKGKNQAELLKSWVSSFAGKEWVNAETSRQNREAHDVVYEELGEGVKEGSMVVSNGQLCIAQRGKAVPLAVNANKVKGHSKVECFEAYQGIKKALSDLLQYQTDVEDDSGLQPLLKALNKAYDDFVKTYGHLHKNTSISFLKSDVDFANILALEKFSERGDLKTGKRIQEFGKTDIFSQRVVEKEKAPEPTNVKDGIIASIYVYGRVDVPWITEQLSGKTAEHTTLTEDDVKAEIVRSGLGFENPVTRQMEVSYEYLSGNVREKLAQATQNNSNGQYDANIKALEKVIPDNIPAHLIDFSIGSSWIDPKLYEEYVKEKTDIDVTFTSAGGTWFMRTPYSVSEQKNRAMGVVSELLHKTIMGTQLIEAAMQNKTITVSETHKKWDGSTETITDKEATQACSNKIDEIRQDFKEWARAKMQSDPAMSEHIERIYNDMFNNYAPMKIEDTFVPIHFAGASKKITLDPHQSHAAMRAVLQPVMLAHEVGAGKTFTLITAAMEMRRLGTAKKPMIVVQNATVGQFVESAKELYLSAKVLTIEEADRTAEGRKNFYAKIKYNDWDMIVVPQSVFERIPDSEERQMKFVQDKIEEKMLVLEQMRDADPDSSSWIVKQAEKEINKLEDELAGLTDSISSKRKERDEKKEAVTRQNAEVKALEMLDRQTDDVENFDDMGIDAILVDEAHEYKHLGFATAMQRGVKGVDPSYSKKAQGVYLKTQAVLEKNNGRNVVFATGTPISNTAAEIWTFMRYLMPADTMKEYGIYYFDDFVRNFGNLQQMLEFTTSGKFKESNRFAGYVNLPELVRIWAGVADTMTQKEIEEYRKKMGKPTKIPRTELLYDNGDNKAEDIYLPQTRALRSVMKYVKKRLDDFDKMSGKEKKENSHIPLTMYGIAKAAAVDARLVVSDAADEPQSKTNEAVRQTLRSLRETESYSGTVALFADNYQNKKSGFNLYEDIREKLIAQGVPAEQIVVMKSGMSVKKKLEIFDKVNRGEIRVIMGSTFTLGTGVNIQERLHTLIHLDAPNRPMDYTQRNGRILRQGNLHKEMGKPVRVLRFGVEDSLDVTAYQRLKTKGAIADSIMNGKQMMSNSMENRVLEEEEDVFGDTVAQLSGSEYAMLKNQAEKDVRKYEAKKKQYQADQTYCHNEIPRLDGEIRAWKERLDKYRKNLAIVEAVPQHTEPSITVGKQTFPSIEAMADFIKEYNKSIKEAENDLRDNPSLHSQTRRLTVNVGGIDFVFTTEQNVETKEDQGTLFSAVRRKMTYSCEALGLTDVPVRQSLLREGLEDIVKNVISGQDFREGIERSERIIDKNEKSLAQVRERHGKPFEFEKELEQAHERFDEYSELMKKELEEKEKKYAEMDADVEDVDVNEAAEVEDEDTVGDEDVRFKDGGGRDEGVAQVRRRFDELNSQYSGKAFDVVVLDELSDDEVLDLLGATAEEREEITPEEVEKVRDWLKNGKRYASYNSLTGKIIIFADKVPEGKEEEAFFHENIHGVLRDLYGDGVRPVAELFWEIAPDNGLVSRDFVKRNYESAKQKEEYFVYWLSRAMVKGRVDEELDLLGKEETNIKDYGQGTEENGEANRPEVQEEEVGNSSGMGSETGERRRDRVLRGVRLESSSVRGIRDVVVGILNSIGYEPSLEAERRLDMDSGVNSATGIPGGALSRLAGSYEPRTATRRYTRAEQSAYVERKLKQLRRAATELVEKLGLTGRVTILDSDEGLGKRYQGKRGWYDEKKGTITVVLGNHSGKLDVLETVLHEGVAHYGLRRLFGRNFDQFLDNVFEAAEPDVRARIVKLATRHKWDFRIATEEYLADLAERIDYNAVDNVMFGWWTSIKRMFFKMLGKLGLKDFADTGIELSDNELRYILWRSYQNLAEPGRYRNPFSVAKDMDMQLRLGVSSYDKERARIHSLGRIDDSSRVLANAVAEGGNFVAEPQSTVLRFSGGDLEDVNARFNEQLANFTLASSDDYVFDLGSPSLPLLAAGVEDKPIRLYGSKVAAKMRKHGFNASELRDLPYAVAHPIAVFDNLGRIGNRSVLTELQKERGNILVTIDIGKGTDVDFDIVSSVFGKRGSSVVEWINKGFLRFVDKEKALNYLHLSAPIAEASNNPELNSAAKVVEEFENPKLFEENLSEDSKKGGVLFRDGDGDFSERDRAIARDRYEKMVSEGLYQFQEAVQDSMLGLKKLYDAILTPKGKVHMEDVEGYENAYLAENRMSSVNAAEQHDYYLRFMQPLLEEIGKLTKPAGKTSGHSNAARIALTDYMMAKHGLERNRVFAERDAREVEANGGDFNEAYQNFREKDYSGLTALTGENDVLAAEDAAQQIVDDYEAAYDTADLWDRTREATHATLEKIYRSGLLSKERYEQIRDMFQYYIPLQGWDETTSDEVYGYLTSKSGPFGGSPIKHAVGRSSKADDPVATIAMMADAAIRQGNRNLMKQRFLNFVLNHPSDLVSVRDLWLEYDAVADEWVPVFADIEDGDTAADVERKVEAFEQRMEQLAEAEPDRYKRGRDAQSIPYKVVKGNMKEHQVLVKRGGRTYVLTINGNPRAAQALNGLTNPDVEQGGAVGKLLKAGEWVNRHLSAFYTTRYPDFVVSNFFRDMLYSNCMTWVKESPRYALRYHKNFGMVANPVMMRRLLGKWEHGTLDRNKRLEEMFYQFMMNGGETGYTSVRDIEEHKREIAKELKKQGSMSRKAWSALGMQLDLLNRSVENCARFAAFVTSREMGRSIDRSIYDAKEVSVNFNKKGSGSKMLNSKGQDRNILKLLANPKTYFSEKDRAELLAQIGSYVGGGGRLAFVFWNAGVQGLTNFGRAGKRHGGKAFAGAATMFIVGYVIPQLAAAMGGGDGDDDDKNAYYNLPEYVRRSNICFRVGDQWVTIPLPIEFRSIYGLGELASGVISGNEHYDNKELSYQIVSQVSQILPLDMLEGGGGVSPWIPSSAKPFVEAYWMNKGWTGLPIYKETPWNQNDPEWTKAYKNTDQTLVGASKWLNENTGGDDFKKGAIDINPAKLEYLLSGVFGGYVTTAEKLKKMGETALGNREFDWRNMLIANRVVKTGDERTANRKLQNEYFKYKKEYEETKRLMRKYKDAADEGIAGMAEKVDFLYNSPEYLRYELFNKYKADIDDYREDLQEATDDSERKSIEGEMYATMRELIDLLHEVK